MAYIFVLVALPFIFLGLLIGGFATTGNSPVQGMPAIVLLIAPFLYGLLGYALTFLACMVYNAIARFTGGIEIQLEELDQTKKPKKKFTRSAKKDQD